MTDNAGDWQALRGRLDRFAKSLEMALEALPVGELDKAKTVEADESEIVEASEEAEILTFGWGRERFALETRWVRSVIDEPTVLPVPGLPNEHGLLLLGKTPLPVFDLGAILGLEQQTTVARAVMVVGAADAEIGLVAAEKPVWSRSARLHPLPWRLDELNAKMVRGVTASGDLVLDGAALLEDERFFLTSPLEGPPRAALRGLR